MIEKTVAIATADGQMETFLTHPEAEGRYPVVIFYMDALGIREELRDMARRIATVGYCVALPNLFYRDGGPSFDGSKLPGTLDPKANELNMALTHARVLGDTEALLGFVADEPAAHPGAKGCVGYCMGGRHAYAAAGTFPGHFKAMGSMHGGFQVTERADSPHLLTEKLEGEAYFGFAVKDPVAPPEHWETIGGLLKQHGKLHQLEVHEGALHGFTFPERYCYDKQAAERVWERLFAMFRRQLG